MKTILTGIRSNSEITLGNYLGALLPMVRLANKYSKEYNINIFVPDLHSIISEVDGNLVANTIRSLKYYLASGLELNDNVHIYRQSFVPAHSELCWILDCVATMGETSRMIQYKEKSKGQDSCNVGIFNYPILMAADILLYDAEFIPIGEDQFQHIELTRNLAIRFNNKFGEIFTVPAKTKDQVKFMGSDEGIRVRDLLNPEKKMSKSTPAENSKIMMNDAPEKAAKKIMSATTDSFGKIKFDMWSQPGISNLMLIESLVNDVPLAEVCYEWNGGTRYGDLKKKVAESVSQLLTDFHAKLEDVTDEQIFELLEKGESYANKVANAKLLEAQKAFGLR
ncbi:tryptophan--tRNA ligase [Candidatus Saccharibacteria bacterium]|nr:tryptophan--tRNA ligase [Candidatus Saccharibacteria bacterium]